MEDSRNKRKKIIWNSLGGGFVAFQSAILLFLAARLYDQETAGVISIAYAIAVFIYTIGRYGMRNYQATDVRNKYSFREYLNSRYISLSISIILLFGYLTISMIFNGYSAEKSIVIFEIVFLRLVNGFEDVFCGHLQRIDHFLEGAKIMAIREGITLLVIIVLMAFRLNLMIVFLVGILLSIMIDYTQLTRIKSLFIGESNSRKNHTANLLRECFPLAFGTAFAVYLSNLPKYVTDWYLDDSIQAIVGYLILPVFTIALLNQFIYNPFIRDLSELYHNGERKQFHRRIARQTMLIMMTTVVVGLITVIVGIPILSFLFKCELSDYRREMILLIAGGCMYAIQYYLTIPVTVIQQQKLMLYGYIVTIILSTLIQKGLVQTSGLLGVALVYIFANLVMTLFLILLLWRKNKVDIVKSERGCSGV